MLNGKIVVLTILVSAIYNCACAYEQCSVTTGFDIEKLEGTWHFVAAVSPKKENGRCGHMTLERKSETTFTGHRISWHDGRLVMLPITVDVYGDQFILQFKASGRKAIVIEMKMTTCNGVSEFAVENPKGGLYLIFSQGKAVSDEFLRYYRALGHRIRSPIQIMTTRKC